MSIYISVLVFFSLCIPLEKLSSAKKKYVASLMMLVLIILGTIRSNSVGSDTANYQKLFINNSLIDYKNIAQTSKGMLIYDYFSKILSSISQNPQIITLVLTLLTSLFILFFILKISRYPIFSVYLYYVLYFYFFSLNGARQSFAMSLSLIAYVLFKDNKYRILSIALLIIAIGIHSTAVITIIYFLLSKIKLSNKLLMSFMIISSLSLLLIDKVIYYFLLIFPRYTMYFSGGEHSFSDVGQGNKILLSFFYLILILVFYFLNKKNFFNEKRLSHIFIFSLGAIIGIVFSKNLLMSRMEIYFTIFSIISIPDIYDYIYTKTKEKREMLILLSILSIIVFSVVFFAQLLSNSSGVVPYSTVF